MFEKDEVEKLQKKKVLYEVLGYIIINLSQVKMQADEYNSFCTGTQLSMLS